MKILPTIEYYWADYYDGLNDPFYIVKGNNSIKYCRTWWQAYYAWFVVLVKG